LTEIYSFHDENITLDVLLKIEKIVTQIAEQKQIDFESAYELFAKSAIYRTLQNTDTKLWAESTEFIVNQFDLETQT
jgi:hypothetical protein